MLIGHSLGGAAVLTVAKDIREVRAVVTIGAPADAAHVLKNFGASLEAIDRDGDAQVDLAGRTFRIGKQFVKDVRAQHISKAVAAMRKPLLILHAPRDETVGIDNATEIFTAAKHPKSFVSLDTADHLLTRPEDAAFAASVIAGWLSRYIVGDVPQDRVAIEHVRVTERGRAPSRTRCWRAGTGCSPTSRKAWAGSIRGPRPTTSCRSRWAHARR